MRKRATHLTVLLLFLTTFAFAQRPVFEYGQPFNFYNADGEGLDLALAGGLNSPQFSTIDLDDDGVEELFVFDRTADRILTFALTENNWRYAPDLELLFPSDIRYWAILRDMNCDGRKDLVAGAGFGIDVYLNFSDGLGGIRWDQQGTISSVTPNGDFVIPASGADLPAIEDIDGDGDLDILVFDFSTGTQINYNRNMSVETYGDCRELIFERVTRTWGGIRECECGVLTFGDECPPASGRIGSKLQHAGGKSLTLYDVDGDGDMDLFMGDETCEAFYYLENRGTPEEALMTGFTSDYPASAPARPGFLPSAFVEDIDQDGTKDLVVASGLPRRVEINEDFKESAWYYRQTNGGFELQEKDFLQGEMVDVGVLSTVAYADVDEDGDQDILMATYGETADSTFASSVYLFSRLDVNGQPAYELTDDDFLGFRKLGFRNLKIGTGRINNDDREDLVFMGSASNSFVTNLYYIAASGNGFDYDPEQAVILNAEAGFNTNFALEDVNGDGLDDLLIGRQFGSLAYYVNNRGSFTLSDDAFLGIDDDASRANVHVAFADFNNDGTRDMIAVDFRGLIYFYPDYRNFNSVLDIAAPLTYATSSLLPRSIRTDNRTWLAVDETSNFPDILTATSRGGLSYLINRSMSEMPIVDNDPLEINVYPNPARLNYVRLLANKTCIVDIFDTSGREVLGDYRLERNREEMLRIDELPAGMYIVRSRTNYEAHVLRFVKYE